MIILDTVNKSLEVKLAGAVSTSQLTFMISYVDLDATFTLSTASEDDGVTNNGTAVTLMAAPASTHTRQVKFLTVYNADSAAATVTIQINNTGTARILTKPTLQPGETLQYAA